MSNVWLAAEEASIVCREVVPFRLGDLLAFSIISEDLLGYNNSCGLGCCRDESCGSGMISVGFEPNDPSSFSARIGSLSILVCSNSFELS